MEIDKSRLMLNPLQQLRRPEGYVIPTRLFNQWKIKVRDQYSCDFVSEWHVSVVTLLK